MMETINTTGGPILLLAASLLDHWRGVDGENWADYDRACAIKDYVGLIDVGLGTALVIADELGTAIWLGPEGGRSCTFVCPSYSDMTDREFDAAMRQVPDGIFRREAFRFRVGAGPHYLFDSAYSGDRLRETDHLGIDLTPGVYDVLTADYQPAERTRVVLHRLIRCPDRGQSPFSSIGIQANLCPGQKTAR